MQVKDRAANVEEIAQAEREWEQTSLFPFMQRRPERRTTFRTMSGTPLERLYTPVARRAARLRR